MSWFGIAFVGAHEAKITRMYSPDIYVASLIPLLVLYLLLVIRLVEGRMKQGERKAIWAPALRDVLLATLALDVAAVAQEFRPGAQSDQISWGLVVALALFSLHLTFMLLNTKARTGASESEEEGEGPAGNSALLAFMVTLVVMTNGMTVGLLLQSMELAL